MSEAIPCPHGCASPCSSVLCDVEEWEADCGVGAWATLEKISRRLKDELGRPPRDADVG